MIIPQDYQQVQQPMPQPQLYEYPRQDLMNEIGSIIKDISDPAPILESFELKIRGLKKDKEGNKIKVSDPLITDEQCIAAFMGSIESVMNMHNDYSFYEDNAVHDYVRGWYVSAGRWMLKQGDKIPTYNRAKLLIDATFLINASIHKAKGGKMLIWSKGQISEGVTHNSQPEQRGILSRIFQPWKK